MIHIWYTRYIQTSAAQSIISYMTESSYISHPEKAEKKSLLELRIDALYRRILSSGGLERMGVFSSEVVTFSDALKAELGDTAPLLNKSRTYHTLIRSTPVTNSDGTEDIESPLQNKVIARIEAKIEQFIEEQQKFLDDVQVG